MNKVILVGRLVCDPEVRYTQSGKCSARFSLAVSRFLGGKNNTTDFIPIVAWEKLAEICGNNLVKGSQVLVEGHMQVRNYEAKDGTKRYVTEVVGQSIEFLGSKKSGQAVESISNDGVSEFGSEVLEDEEPISF